MFGKNTIIYEREMVPYEKSVTIKRAPTDESVAILNEMQEKAMQNLIKTVNVKDNSMNAVVFYSLHGMDRDSIKFIAKFSFNGKEYKLEGQVAHSDLSDSHRYGCQSVANAIAYKLCELMIKEVFKEVGLSDLEGMKSRL